MALLVCLSLFHLVAGFDVKPANSLLPSTGKSGLIEERTTLQGTWTGPHPISGYGGGNAVNGPDWSTQIAGGLSWGSYTRDQCGAMCDNRPNECYVAMWRENWACVLFPAKTCGQVSYAQNGCPLWDSNAWYYERAAASPPPPPSVNYDQWIHFENQYNGVTTKSYLDLYNVQSNCTGTGNRVQTRMSGVATTGGSHWKIVGGSGCVKYGDEVRIINGQTGHYLDSCGNVNCGIAGFGVHTFPNADRDVGTTKWSIWGGTQGSCVALGAQVTIKNHYAGLSSWLDSCGWVGDGGAFGVQVVPTTDRAGSLTGYWKVLQAASDPPSSWQAPHSINGYAQQAVVGGLWATQIAYISGSIDRTGCEQACKGAYASTCQSATWRGNNFGCTLFAFKCDQANYPAGGSNCAVWGEAAWYYARP